MALLGVNSEILTPGSPITPSLGAAVGLTRWALADERRFLKAARGVYTPRPEDPAAEFAARVGAVVRHVGRPTVACGLTGLALMGVALPDRLSAGLIELMAPRGATAWPKAPGVVVRRQDGGARWVTAQGVPTAPPELCWVQAARAATQDELVVLGDGLTRRTRPVTTLARLEDFVAAAKGVHGVSAARAAFPLLRAGTDSPRETVTRLLVVRAGLPCPEVNLEVRTRDGVRYLDMAYAEERLALEYDGKWHAANLDADARRRRTLEDSGWRIMTVTDHDLVHDPESILSSLRAALRSRARATQPLTIRGRGKL
jgi:hypothetical protein